MAFRDRPAPDLIVFALTGLVCVTVVLVMILTVVMEANGKAAGDGIVWVSRIINTIVGGVFGYLAGRSVRSNGKPME